LEKIKNAPNEKTEIENFNKYKDLFIEIKSIYNLKPKRKNIEKPQINPDENPVGEKDIEDNLKKVNFKEDKIIKEEEISNQINENNLKDNEKNKKKKVNLLGKKRKREKESNPQNLNKDNENQPLDTSLRNDTAQKTNNNIINKNDKKNHDKVILFLKKINLIKKFS
jgi:hypothetical protein